MRKPVTAALLLAAASPATAQQGAYTNPILDVEYSDPALFSFVRAKAGELVGHGLVDVDSFRVTKE